MKKYLTNSIFLTLSTLLLLTNLTFSQSNKTIATVGQNSILLDEFKHRFELTPGFSLGGAGMSEIERRNFLFTLIAEYLWAEEASARGFDSSAIMRFTFPAIQKMYLRNELFKQEIESKARFTEKELAEAVEREKSVLTFNFIHSFDSTEIFSIYKNLLAGIKFDSIFHKRDESSLQEESLQITFGVFDEKLEEFLYKIKLNSFSIPFQKKEGWFIYYLRAKHDNVVPGKDIKQRIKSVRELLKLRKTESAYQSFYSSFFSGKRIETNGELFWSIFDKIHAIYENVRNNDSLSIKSSYKLSISDIKKIENAFGADSLSLIFIKIDNREISVLEFLRNFIFDGFYTEPVSAKVLSAKLNMRVRTFIEMELLAAEAERRGMGKTPEVQASINRWKNYYLAEEFKGSLIDSIKISENDVEQYYHKAQGDSLLFVHVNIVEILTDSLDVIQTILNEIELGVDFKELAKRHSKRIGARENGGETGLFPASALGETGKIAAQLSIGDVYGPLTTQEGYVMFKLLDKKMEGINNKSYDEVKDELRKEVGYSKIEKYLKDKTIEFAKKHGVSIDESLLYNTSIKNLSMYVIQYMGFGGKLPAVPSTTPFIKWYEEYQKSIDVP